MKQVKKVLKVVLLVVLALGLAFSAVLLYHLRLIKGPKLKPSPKELSLSSDIPPASGWNEQKLQAAFDYMNEAGTTSTIIIQDGKLVAEWGDTQKISSVHSVRKSIVSALYGIAVDKGLINIEQTLEELGIDDHNPPLTQQEKQARIEDLLTARSGIYHPSVKGSEGGPPPGAHPPNTFFFYNNWSFNAVGILFEQLTQKTMGEAFYEWIAIPTGMQDFKAKDVIYTEGEESVFPSYRFFMSNRDLARFGMLYMYEGRWKDKQVIPSEWVSRTFHRFSGSPEEVSYGYMWWIMPSGIHMATGTGGQKIWIDPENKLMIVNKVNTGVGFTRAIWWTMGVRVSNTHMRALNKMLLDAQP